MTDFPIAAGPAISPGLWSVAPPRRRPVTLSQEPADSAAPSPDDPLDAILISDLHLGSVACQAKAVAALLEEILDGRRATRRLIINGDVFDSIDFRRLRKTHWKVLSLIRHLSDKMDVIWIAGNHDGSAEIVSHLLGVRVAETFIFNTGGRRVLVLHGHQFDDFLDDHPIVTWLADCIYGLLQKLDRTHYVARLAKRRSKVFVHCVEKIRAGALVLARQRQCDAVICGHTHQAVAETTGPIHYFNTGCWTERPSTYLAASGGRIAVHHVHGPSEAATVESLPAFAA